MSRRMMPVILLFLFVVSGILPSPDLSAQDLKSYTIAVLNLDAKGISQSEAEYLSEYMRGQVTRLISSADFRKETGIDYTVVERAQMDKIFDQFEIQNTGCVDVSCAIEFGKMLSVERILIGSAGLVGQTYSIAARIVDVESARTIGVADYQYTGPIDELLRTGISSVVNDIMYGQRPKSHRNLYITAGVAVLAGVTAAVLSSSKKGGEDQGKITIKIPVPQN